LQSAIKRFSVYSRIDFLSHGSSVDAPVRMEFNRNGNVGERIPKKAIHIPDAAKSQIQLGRKCGIILNWIVRACV
jgi:hypothetical protein